MEPNIPIIELNGRFDAHQVDKIQAEAETYMSDGHTNLLFDLHDVHFIDTRAISLLVTTMKRCRQQGGDLRLYGLQQPVQIIFEMMRLERVFQIYEDKAQALASYDQRVT